MNPPGPDESFLIWIQSGLAAFPARAWNSPPNRKRRLFNNVVRISDALRQARVTVYSVDPLGTADILGGQALAYERFSSAVRTAKQVQVGSLALQVLAAQSGGRIFNSSNDVTAEIASSAADANSFYILTLRRPCWGRPERIPRSRH